MWWIIGGLSLAALLVGGVLLLVLIPKAGG